MKKSNLVILTWSIFAALVMCLIQIGLPEWIMAFGVAIGFIGLVLIEKTTASYEYLKKVTYAIVFLIIVTVFSYIFILLSCGYLPNINKCSDRANVSLVLADLFFVGAPILVVSVFVWLARYVSRFFRK